VYDWKDKLAAGKEGVELIITLLKARPETVFIDDVQDEPKYQPKGIDLLWHRKGTNGSVEVVSVEVKWDTYTSGNIALETVSVVETGTTGCFLTSEADLWVYCFPGYAKALVIPLRQAREWFTTHQDRYRRRVTSSRDSGRSEWHTEVALVPIDDLTDGVPTIQVMPLPSA
jgi:hypothetical protein